MRKPYFVLFALFLCLAGSAIAQPRLPLPRASQNASVMQRVASTDISISYSRPVIKGRTVWGDAPADKAGEKTLDNPSDRGKDAPLVLNGHVWRAGANEATLFTTSSDLMVQGQLLSAGSYSLHMIPNKEEWTVIFNKDDGQWGSFDYDTKKDALRVKTKPEWVTDSHEALEYRIEPTGASTATVVLRWEKIRVPFKVEVKDANAATMARIRPLVTAAKSDDSGTPLSAANWSKNNGYPDEAKTFYEQALKAVDAQLKAKENFQSLQQKATILLGLNRGPEALIAAERAVVVGKADPKITPAAIAALEKRIADLKAKK